MFIISSKKEFIRCIFGFKFGKLGKRLLIIQKLFAIFYLQLYKFLIELTVLATASLRFPIVFGHFHSDSVAITPTFS